MSQTFTDRLIRSLRQATRRWLLAILSIYLILSVGYGLATPLFEAPDEQHHFYTALSTAANRRLPTTGDENSHLTGQEAAQPPLYYFIATLVATPFDLEVSEEVFWPNPAVQLGAADSPQNTNAFIHTQAESWPWHDHVLVAHLFRLLSALLGIGTLLALFGCARLVWPVYPERALLVTALVAFLPQFAFLHGSISNDPLIILLCSTAIWQLLRMWYGEMNWLRLVLLGLTVGLAMLSKTAGLLLLAYALIFAGLIAWREQGGRSFGKKLQQMVGPALAIAIPALILGGWLLWRNWGLYRDITAANEFVRLAGGDRGYSLLQVLKETPGLWTSLFAVFGWFNVLAPQCVFLIWYGIVAAAVAGAIIGVRRGRRATRKSRADHEKEIQAARTVPLLDRHGAIAVLLALWVVMVYAGLVNFMLKTPAAQGRLLFPAVVPLALGLSYGLSNIRWPGVYLLVPGLALLTSVYSLLFVIPGAYERPPVVALEELPDDTQQIDVDLGQGVRLLASRMETEQAQPDEWVWLTLYWQATGAPDEQSAQEAPMYVAELFGRDNALLGKLQSYHGGGLYPATLWSSGDVLADQVAVRLDQEIALPVQARLNVKLAGQETSVDVGTVKVIPQTWPEPAGSILAHVNGIDLAGATLSADGNAPGDTAGVELRWQVREAPGEHLTTFVHLGDPSDPPLAQGDNTPLGGHYPTTLWSSGEVFSDTYELVMPSDLSYGLYPVHVGLYRTASGERLPLTVDGTRQPNDAYLVGWLEVQQ